MEITSEIAYDIMSYIEILDDNYNSFYWKQVENYQSFKRNQIDEKTYEKNRKTINKDYDDVREENFSFMRALWEYNKVNILLLRDIGYYEDYDDDTHNVLTNVEEAYNTSELKYSQGLNN